MGAPIPSHSLVRGDKIDPVWFRYLQSLDGKANASDIRAIATALGSPDGTVANIPPLSGSTVTILQGAGIAVTRDDAGAYAIALRPLEDSGVGTFKLITRDTTGRISGSLDGSAADVPYDNATSGLAATNTQAAIDELVAEKLDDAPSDGDTYGRKDGAWQVVGGGSGAMTLLDAATVSGSAASTITISGLDLSAYKAFIVYFSLKNATASTATVSLYYNSDTTATNYYQQLITGNGGLSGSRTNNGLISSLVASEIACGEINIQRDLNGRPHARSHTTSGAPATILLQDFAHVRDNTANVTEVTLSSSVASAFDIGSGFRIYGIS